MTRHSPSEAALGEIPVSGLHANFTLLTAFNEAVGKEVLLELVDGSVFTGIFGGASSELEVGLYCAYEKTAENEQNLLPLKKDIVQKRQFAFSDIVCVTVPTTDEKMMRGFATDRDYHSKRKLDEEHELEAWEGDGEDVDLESEETMKSAKTAARNGGWGVNEMFAANLSLGVKTTFEDNLSQYTTADVEGTEEDRRRADEIARQIEKSGSSRMYSALENDDEERDLDKTTDEADLLGLDAKNRNAWSDGIPTAPPPSTEAPSTNGVNDAYWAQIRDDRISSNAPNRNQNGQNNETVQSGQSPRPPSLMCTTPPGFPSPPGGFCSSGFTTVGRGRKGTIQSDHSHNTYLPLANNRGMNNNGRGGSQMVSKNNRAEGLKGGMAPVRGGPLPSPKNTPGQGGPQSMYGKRDYEGPTGGQSHNYEGGWSTKGGMKTFENTKMRNEQKMMLENRNAPSNSPRNAGGPPSAPSSAHNQKGTGRVEGLKAWQNDFNYRETRPQQKGPGEKVESTPHTAPLMESAPPTKNAWQSGPPSGLTSASRSEETKSGGGPSPSPSTLPSSTPVETKNEEKEAKEDAGASTSHEEERADESGGEKKDDSDVSAESSGSKKFSFNPDAPAFTPKFGGSTGGGGMGGGPALIQHTPMMMTQPVPMVPTMMGGQTMSMQAPMSMGGMQQPMQIYPYAQPHYNMQPNMQYSAVVNGGGIMAGAAQNGQGQTGTTAPSTPRGGQNGGMGGGRPVQQRQTGQTGNATGGGTVPVTMSANPMYVQQTYQPMALPQQNYMQPQPNYYQYGAQPQMIQGTYQMPMTMQQPGMMGQHQRGYVAQPTHPGMMMQYSVPQQQQYGGGPPPPGVNAQQGGVVTSQVGTGGATPSVSASTNGGGPPSNGNGAGGGQSGAPPSQPPTPGAVPSVSGGVTAPQGGLLQGAPPGMAPPVASPAMYGMQYAAPGMVYYGQGGGAPMGGMEMHGGEGGEGTMHPMHYQYNAGQYYQGAPPHLRAAYPTMNHNMQQQPQHAPAQPSQSQN